MTSQPTDPKITELIRQTDAEMQRLGWTQAQGREHLMKFYGGRRSRLQLTEEELDNFLLFLQLTDTPETELETAIADAKNKQ